MPYAQQSSVVAVRCTVTLALLLHNLRAGPTLSLSTLKKIMTCADLLSHHVVRVSCTAKVRASMLYGTHMSAVVRAACASPCMQTYSVCVLYVSSRHSCSASKCNTAVSISINIRSNYFWLCCLIVHALGTMIMITSFCARYALVYSAQQHRGLRRLQQVAYLCRIVECTLDVVNLGKLFHISSTLRSTLRHWKRGMCGGFIANRCFNTLHTHQCTKML
jgi:hypothetical protein